MELIRSTLDLESRVRVMGVLNVTPDSFSDGGKYADLEIAIARAFACEPRLVVFVRVHVRIVHVGTAVEWIGMCPA